jgi:hypothetical protein
MLDKSEGRQWVQKTGDLGGTLEILLLEARFSQFYDFRIGITLIGD